MGINYMNTHKLLNFIENIIYKYGYNELVKYLNSVKDMGLTEIELCVEGEFGEGGICI